MFSPMGIDYQVGYGVFWSQVLTRMIEEQIDRGVEWIIIVDYDSYYLKEHLLRGLGVRALNSLTQEE